ncbi:hypothetical protein [Nocardia sp. CNY236]|uniref:hypothetical protein n=1 Tax=Nocardia sp. CNY236 TaxID=1169152 RepID=UPI000419AF3A|nr:hypothetical protein [Nocardia sp. CNY236]
MRALLSRTRGARIRTTGFAVAVLVAALAGCTDIERALNRGGDTPCSQYIEQDQDAKRMTITKFVKQQTQNENEPSGTVVDATMVAVELLCGTQANADTPIKDADVAGIFFHK